MSKKRNKPEEKIPRTLDDLDEPRSRASRVRMLLKKNEGIFKDKQALTEFKEPVAMLRRRGGGTEIYEDASKGVFKFKHSDGKDREIYLEPSLMGYMDYGKRKFKYYWLHEDSPMPIPENPTLMAEALNMLIEKSLMDMQKLNEKREEIKLKTMKVLIWGAIGLILLFILYKTGAFDKIVSMITGQPLNPEVIDNRSMSEKILGSSLDVTSSIILPVVGDLAWL